jgi:hypothetical protein
VLPRAPTVEPPQLVPGAITQQPQPVPQPPPPQSPRPQQQAQTAPGVRQIIPGKPRPDVPILKDDPAMLTQLASQARSGDTSVFTNLGRGAQGPENIKVLRAEMARQDREAPRDDAEEELRGHGVQQAMRNAEYFGTKAGQRTLGTRVANIELAATEFKKIMPVVLQASDAVDRSKYTNLNQLLLAWKDRTGDPASVALGGAINTAINVYARAVNPTGASTVSDKDHAREQLQRAWSQGQIKAALAMMQQEIDLALTAPDDVREEWRRRFREGQKRGGGEQKQEAPQPTPKASGTTKSGVKWSIP